MEFEIASGTVKGKKRIIGFDLISTGVYVREEEKFCQHLSMGWLRYIRFTDSVKKNESKLVIEISKYGINWDKHSFVIGRKEKKVLENILKTNYISETTEDNIFQLRIDENRKVNRYPGSRRSRNTRKKLKRAKKRK